MVRHMIKNQRIVLSLLYLNYSLSPSVYLSIYLSI
jgi:hypothetical protein